MKNAKRRTFTPAFAMSPMVEIFTADSSILILRFFDFSWFKEIYLKQGEVQRLE
jgi:hypothetical protein